MLANYKNMEIPGVLRLHGWLVRFCISAVSWGVGSREVYFPFLAVLSVVGHCCPPRVVI